MSRLLLPSRRRITTGRAMWDVGVLMVALGTLIGVGFPPIVVLMGVPHEVASTFHFRSMCFVAGAMVAVANFVLVRVVIGSRLSTLSDRLAAAAESVQRFVEQPNVAVDTGSIEHIPVDSRDELGDAADSFNSVLDALTALERFRALVLNSSDVIAVMDDDGRLVGHTGALERTLGYHDENTSPVRLATLLHPDDVRTATTNLAALLSHRNDRSTVTFVARVSHEDGSWRHLEIVATDRRADPSIAGVLLACRDVSDRVALQDELTHQALHDGLTGLANRELFGEQIEMARDREQPSPIAVLFCDLDGFKNVNDGFGHAVGDELLIEVARRLDEHLRDGDSAARIGGDEFAVLLDGSLTDDEILKVAERLIEALSVPMMIDGHEVRVGCSIGIAIDPGTTTTTDELLRDADTAMYVAKSQGKGTATVFRPSLHEALIDRITLQRELSRAVERSEMVLHYQPVLDLATSRASSVEALIRWRHPERGLLGPDRFIGLAEETGAIIEIGRWVLSEACRQAVIWRETDELADLAMAVNVSVRQLDRDDFVETVCAALDDSGLDPGALTLELTESVIAIDDTDLVERLRALRAIGVRIAVDDFGTGYSSLSYLRRLPLDVIKIDRSFVDEITRDDPALVRMMTQLAADLGFDTVAEGIEDLEQLEALRGFECHHGQGYLFSRPVEASAIPTVVAAFGQPAPSPTGGREPEAVGASR